MTQNYHVQGGDEWVVGGKLTFLPGATVEGAIEAMGVSNKPLLYQPPSDASTVAALRDQFNALLASMQASGIMAMPDDPPDE